ncbi:hypothetical protein CANCADRAFT_146512 [Tortispora caseinolytica NRRL Y-17796]|uniref:Uncharacterized protein n=1 Tax=Tortispora caseinolytica NRRL Y-17796 TaxID=767744 RepID=A0A1E4T9L2_9ASCO|nr:hypothetical protein CANCADRAFT_146512 [Tortispora caseinolytica NRRL Y-17796]
MASELADEVLATNSIYPECLVEVSGGRYVLRPPDCEGMEVVLDFPETYPEVGPRVVSVRPDKYSAADIQAILENDVFREGEVCVFELIDALRARVELDSYDPVALAALEESVAPVSYDDDDDSEAETNADIYQTRRKELGNYDLIDWTPDDDPRKGWNVGEPVVDRKSTFLGFAVEVHSVEEVQQRLEVLKLDKKVGRATHNMYAYRIKLSNGMMAQDCDDDGETAAGSRMLHLLSIMGVENVLVVVSRWFGGTLLGPDRFKDINVATRNALEAGNFLSDKKKK